MGPEITHQDILFKMTSEIGELKGMVSSLCQRHDQFLERLKEQEQRITALEQSRAWLLGAGAVGGTALTVMLKHLGLKF